MRNAYDFDCHEATSFWYVIKDSFGGMEELSSKMRNQVRKSLKTYDVRRISREEFCRVALPVCSFGARCGSAFEELRLGGAHPTAGQLRCIIISAGFPGRPKQRFRAIFWKSLKRQDSAIIS